MKRRSLCLVILLLALLALSLSIPLGLVSVRVPETTTTTTTMSTTTEAATTTPAPCVENFNFTAVCGKNVWFPSFVFDTVRDVFFTVVKDNATNVKIYSSVGWNVSLAFPPNRYISVHMQQNVTTGDLYVHHGDNINDNTTVISKYNLTGYLLWSVSAAAMHWEYPYFYTEETHQAIITSAGEVRSTVDGSLIRTIPSLGLFAPNGTDEVFNVFWNGPTNQYNVSRTNIDTGVVLQTYKFTNVRYRPWSLDMGDIVTDTANNLYVSMTDFCDVIVSKIDSNMNVAWNTSIIGDCNGAPAYGFWVFGQTGTTRYDPTTNRIYQVTGRFDYDFNPWKNSIYVFALDAETGVILYNLTKSISLDDILYYGITVQTDFENQKLYCQTYGTYEKPIEIKDFCLP